MNDRSQAVAESENVFNTEAMFMNLADIHKEMHSYVIKVINSGW